jgi:hypothetical protein
MTGYRFSFGIIGIDSLPDSPGIKPKFYGLLAAAGSIHRVWY